MTRDDEYISPMNERTNAAKPCVYVLYIISSCHIVGILVLKAHVVIIQTVSIRPRHRGQVGRTGISNPLLLLFLPRVRIQTRTTTYSLSTTTRRSSSLILSSNPSASERVMRSVGPKTPTSSDALLSSSSPSACRIRASMSIEGCRGIVQYRFV